MDCSITCLPVHHHLPEPTQNSRPLSQWCYPSISSSVIPSSCLQSFPASGSFLMSWFFTSGSQSIGALASVPPINIQDWFLLCLTGLTFLQSKGLSRVFSSTTVQKHQFFSAQPSLWSNSHIHTWLLEKPQLWLYGPFFEWLIVFLLWRFFFLLFLLVSPWAPSCGNLATGQFYICFRSVP